MSRSYHPPADQGLDLLFEDADLLVLNKPSGLLSVPGRGADKLDCLATRVQAEFPDALVVHRLDMETSGLLLMARGREAQRELSRQFERREVEKRYQAIVDGRPEPTEGEIDLPLITDWPNRPRQKVDHVEGKPARTRYCVLSHESRDNSCRVALYPITGRSHQLRVHMQSLGHPILGDALYAHPAAHKKASRLLLHAECLAFQHPASSAFLNFNSPCPF